MRKMKEKMKMNLGNSCKSNKIHKVGRLIEALMMIMMEEKYYTNRKKIRNSYYKIKLNSLTKLMNAKKHLQARILGKTQ